MGKKWKDILCLTCFAFIFMIPILTKSNVEINYCDDLDSALETSNGVEDCDVYVNSKDKGQGYVVVGSKYNDLLPEIAKYSYDCTGGSVTSSEPEDGRHTFTSERGVWGINYEVFVEYTLKHKDGRNYLKLSKLGKENIDLADVAVIEDTISEVIKYFK